MAIRWFLLILCLFVLPIPTRADMGFKPVDAAAAQRLQIDGATVIDVRRPDEWRSTGVVPNSRLLTAFNAAGALEPDFFETLLGETEPNDMIVLICRSGARSGAVGRFLAEQQGYSTVYNVDGGIIDWLQHGFAVDPCTDC